MAVIYPLPKGSIEQLRQFQDLVGKFLTNIFDPHGNTQPPAFPGMEAQRPKSLPEIMAEMIIGQQINKTAENK